VLFGLMKRRGIVSFSFDDGTRDFLDNAFPVLREEHIPASLSIIVGLSFPSKREHARCFEGYRLLTAEETSLLVTEGIEILSHGLTHQHASTLSSEMLLREVRDSKNRLTDYGIDAEGFAVPYGDVTDTLQTIVRQHFTYMRTSDVGYNTRLNPDRYGLKVRTLTRATKPENLAKWIDDAAAHDLWLILVFHRVRDDSPSDEYCTPVDTFARMVEYVHERMETRSIGAVLRSKRGIISSFRLPSCIPSWLSTRR